MKDIHIELIDYLYRYADLYGNKDLNIKDFASYILASDANSANNDPNTERIISDDKSDLRLNVEFAKNITYLSRYLKFYLHKVLSNTNLGTEGEYSYLMVLWRFDSLNKTELNNMNIFEKTTGTDIIRRLVKKGFVLEYDDPNDKRSKRVKISEKGIKVLTSVLPALSKVSNLLSYPMSRKEKILLNDHLNKVNSFQENIFINHRTENLDTLEEFLDKTTR